MPEQPRARRKDLRQTRLNFRPLLFCAVGLCSGIFFYMRVRLGGLCLSDFLFLCALFAAALFPLSLRRTAALLLCVLLFAGAGAGLSHLYTERFLTGAEEGRYEVSGTVCDFAVYNGYTEIVLTDLTFDGAETGGKLEATVPSENIRAGDVLLFSAIVHRNGLPDGRDTSGFTDDVRYRANSVLAEKQGERGGFFRLNAEIYDVLREHLPEEEGELAYALLTGNSRIMDGGVLRSVRQGGIAHIFAVSGLHIGILYGAVVFLFRPLKRWAALPAIAVAFCYTAMCGFSVSALRAVIMCSLHALCVLSHRKYDMLNALSASAVLLLLIRPAEWLSAGFRLSFGAVLGLALFAGAIGRGLRRLRCPAFLAGYLSAGLSVQIFTFPVLLGTFGYVSVWGFLLNLVLIPILPVFFLCVLVPTALALILPFAAGVLLAVPYGLCAALLAILLRLDVSLTLTGFSLGAGAVVWMTACVVLSERFRAAAPVRLGLAGGLALLFALLVVSENAVFTGVIVTAEREGDGVYILIRTPEADVLLLNGDAGLADCNSFLSRHLQGAPDAVLLVASDPSRARNAAAFVETDAIYAMSGSSPDLKETAVEYRSEFAVGGYCFRFESPHKLVLFAEGLVVEFDFETKAVLGADFSVEMGTSDLKFYLNDGIIKAV